MIDVINLNKSYGSVRDGFLKLPPTATPAPEATPAPAP